MKHKDTERNLDNVHNRFLPMNVEKPEQVQPKQVDEYLQVDANDAYVFLPSAFAPPITHTPNELEKILMKYQPKPGTNIADFLENLCELDLIQKSLLIPVTIKEPDGTVRYANITVHI